MARKQQKIKTISYCYVRQENGECVLTPTSVLNEEQKERLGVALLVTYNNALFAGKAEFSPPPGFELGRDANGRVTVTRVPVEQVIA